MRPMIRAMWCDAVYRFVSAISRDDIKKDKAGYRYVMAIDAWLKGGRRGAWALWASAWTCYIILRPVWLIRGF